MMSEPVRRIESTHKSEPKDWIELKTESESNASKETTSKSEPMRGMES
jgi:hypothetical protein